MYYIMNFPPTISFPNINPNDAINTMWNITGSRNDPRPLGQPLQFFKNGGRVRYIKQSKPTLKFIRANLKK